MAVINGTASNDSLMGTADADVISGGDGKDNIRGQHGDDTIYGGDGDDMIQGEYGNDVIYGGLGNDFVGGGAGNDVVYGGEGDDGFYGGGDDDSLYGEAGADNIRGDGGNDYLSGGADNDRISGGSGHDTIDGGTGDDTLSGDTGNDVFVVRAGDGNDTIDGGTGLDRVVLDLTSGDVTDALRADLEGYQGWMQGLLDSVGGDVNVLSSQPASSWFTFGSLGFTIGAIEDLTVYVDGTEIPLDDLVNRAPVTDPTVNESTNEDSPLSAQVVATDPDGDDMTCTVSAGPAHGTVVLDEATGEYTYTPDAHYSGSDSFEVTVSDGRGGFANQQINITVGAVVDTPTLTVSDITLSGLEITGGAGDDTLTGGVGSDTISGGAGNDLLYGDGSGRVGGALNIVAALVDLDGSETLSIVIEGVPADATLSSGTKNPDGSWSLTESDLADLTIDAPDTGGFTLVVTATATEGAGGSASSVQTMTVNVPTATAHDVLDGGDGNDTLYGGADDNTLIGGDGDDVVRGQGGNDWVVAGEGNDDYYGGSGFDVLDMSNATGAVRVDLRDGTASGMGNDSTRGFEGLVGSDFNDYLVGNSVDSWISAGDGDDIIFGRGGKDTLEGGAGNDRIWAGSGHDTIRDGEGNDYVNAGNGDDLVIAGGGSNSYYGRNGTDTIDYSLATSSVNVDLDAETTSGWSSDRVDSFENAVGSDFDDTITGSSGDNLLRGGDGADTFRSLEGTDTIEGGAGIDSFVWESGDVMRGNRFLGKDTITDYETGETLDISDLISLSGGQTLADVVDVTDGASGTTISVDMGRGFVDVVTLEGVHGESLSSLLGSGVLIV